jgi:hypothetical protein
MMLFKCELICRHLIYQPININTGQYSGHPTTVQLWTPALLSSSPSNASGHQIAVAQACGLKLNLCHKNSLLRLLRLSKIENQTMFQF